MRNYIWDKYNMLTIIKEVSPHIYPSWFKRRKFLCRCDCWNKKEITINHIKGWKQLSCGCHRIAFKKVHWLNNTRIQRIYNWIQQRCNNPNNTHYQYYWWRWIKSKWGSLSDFWNDMQEWYSDELTIDRIDNNWNYCKHNCKWVTMKEQAQNRRHKTSIYYGWQTKSKTEWAKYYQLPFKTFDQRLRRAWTFEEMILKYNM